MSWWSFKPYVSVAQRKANAMKEVEKLKKKGQVITPVVLESKKIAATFWGKAWCDNLEAYSDFASRLPRGRTYVRNGSVVDLQVGSGVITSLVAGSELYQITIKIKPLASATWKAIRQSCTGQISSAIELLKGKISQQVMQVVTNQETGLFPAPSEIELSCSCPDWAGMCKHVAATLYGVGARLDQQPELLFTLRNVSHLDLVSQVVDVGRNVGKASEASTIAADELADVFGIELTEPAPAEPIKPAEPQKLAVKAPPKPPAKKVLITYLELPPKKPAKKKKTAKKRKSSRKVDKPVVFIRSADPK